MDGIISAVRNNSDKNPYSAGGIRIFSVLIFVVHLLFVIKLLVSGKFLFCLCFELLRLQKLGKQLSLLDKREYPRGEGV